MLTTSTVSETSCLAAIVAKIRLSAFLVWAMFDFLRWLRRGKLYAARAMPVLYKWLVLSQYNSKYQCDWFIETGSYYGYTAWFAATTLGSNVRSIELSQKLAKKAASLLRYSSLRFRLIHSCGYVLVGDSSRLLPVGLSDMNSGDRALIWLDAHYSGGDTASSSADVLAGELYAIAKYNSRRITVPPIVLIDDVRSCAALWVCSEKEFVETVLVKIGPGYEAVVQGDILRLTPKNDKLQRAVL